MQQLITKGTDRTDDRKALPKAIASAGLLAQIVIDKYVDHMPLHHQQQRFSREGINIAYTAPLPIEGVHAQSYNRCTMPWLKK